MITLCHKRAVYLTAIVSADTETDPGTFRTSSAEHQVLEHELARTVTDALSFNHSTEGYMH